MIAYPLQGGSLEGGGPENRDFLGSEMTTSEANAIFAQKSHKNRHRFGQTNRLPHATVQS
jgi:hypothetical protein